jgi:hypothetical protein
MEKNLTPDKKIRPKKKDFKAVCHACMNGAKISRCPSRSCLLAPIKDSKKFIGSIMKLKQFCKACDPQGYQVHAICSTEGGCPLDVFYNANWGRKAIKWPTFIPKRGSNREDAPIFGFGGENRNLGQKVAVLPLGGGED